MGEEWRRKRYYDPRVIIPVDECLESAFGDCLVCLTGGELNLVRNLLQYAHRRSTFVSEYHPQHYLAPTTEEWDALEAMTAHLEGNLMDCEQFTSDLQEILDWVRQSSAQPGGTFSEDEQAAFPYDDVVGDDELTPAEEDACDVAQLWFEWGYQTITEQVLPATRWGFDYLVPAVAGFIALAIGGPPAAMGVYALAELIQELLEIFYRGAETNLINWMDTNKEDVVCVLWAWLVVGGDASSIWQHAMDDVITPAEDISYGDKLILQLFMGSWAGSNAQLAFDAETEWATSNVEEGYCDECEAAPLVWEWECTEAGGWRLGPIYAEWWTGGLGRWWFNDGRIASPTIAGLEYGEYDYKITAVGMSTGEDNPNVRVRFTQKDTDGPWFSAPLYEQFVADYWVGGSFNEYIYDSPPTLTIAHDYLTCQFSGNGQSGGICETYKLELWPHV